MHHRRKISDGLLTSGERWRVPGDSYENKYAYIVNWLLARPGDVFRNNVSSGNALSKLNNVSERLSVLSGCLGKQASLFTNKYHFPKTVFALFRGCNILFWNVLKHISELFITLHCFSIRVVNFWFGFVLLFWYTLNCYYR